MTSLLEASRLGQAKAVQAICDSRRYPRQAALRGELDSTALHVACENGHEAVVRALLTKSHALVNEANAHGKTPLHVACEHGSLGCALLLVEAGAGLNAADVQGCTPLIRACLAGDDGAVQLLAECRAALDATDGVGMSALFRASVQGTPAA